MLEGMEPFLGEEPIGWTEICDTALMEDVGFGDATRFAVPEDTISEYEIECQGDGVVCGLGLVHDLLAPPAHAQPEEYGEYRQMDGDSVHPGCVVYAGRLHARTLLRNERTALNFLMHLSGVATLTRKLVEAVRGTRARILDTRKTLPGLRSLQKYAVRVGGGKNHRFNLSDGVLVKGNHIRAAGGIAEALSNIRREAPHTLRLEVECETVAQVDRALSCGADVILLDNMSIGEIRDAVSLCRGRALVEVSGGVNLENVREIAETGVDFISVGMITHSAPALPFHLKVR